MQSDNKKGIYFDAFPGKTYHEKKDRNKSKRMALIISLIIILIILLLASSAFNVWYLMYGDNSYKMVNEYSGDYAKIPSSKRSELFKRIGFDESNEEVKSNDKESYITTYAYKNHGDNLTDYINVYYDDNNKVNYITLNLIYEKNDFTITSVSEDCNNILKNFMNVNTKEKYIETMLEDGYYYVIDEKTKINISYELVYESNEFYVLTIICQR